MWALDSEPQATAARRARAREDVASPSLPATSPSLDLPSEMTPAPCSLHDFGFL